MLLVLAILVGWAPAALGGASSQAASQSLATRPTAADRPKQAFATRVEQGGIAIDGRLDEDAWLTATPITDFVQGEPEEGAPPSDGMEVRFLYDDTALYVDARMYSQPGTLQAPLSRRDDGRSRISIQIELDTFRDRRTAFMYGVTAAGVRLDHFHPTDNRDDEVGTYDPVWRARTEQLSDGWTAELWLPFTPLRFNEDDERVWGLNIRRYLPGRNEKVYWALVRRVERGWSSRFGELRGITGVAPRGRVEVLPYVVTSINPIGARDPGNPFLTALNPAVGVGADVKMGLGSNLTLDATLNPDFAQVEADPAQVNLTAFEVIFPERRPFFLEGNSVLEAGTALGAGVRGNELGDASWQASTLFSWRPSSSLQYSVEPEYLDEDGTPATQNGPINRQYLTTVAGDGRRPTATAMCSAWSTAPRCPCSSARATSSGLT